MKLLLDTQLLLWAAAFPTRLPSAAKHLIGDPRNELFFSAVSVWEITIKKQLGRADFDVEPAILRRSLLDNGYAEWDVTSLHGIAVARLPLLHKDPFDRLLIAQAQVEGVTLLTADRIVARYQGPTKLV